MEHGSRSIFVAIKKRGCRIFDTIKKSLWVGGLAQTHEHKKAYRLGGLVFGHGLDCIKTRGKGQDMER